MKLLMISGDRSILQGKKGAFYYTLEEFATHWERIDIICPKPWLVSTELTSHFPNVTFHPARGGLLTQPQWIRNKGGALRREHKHDIVTVHEYPPFYNGLGAIWMQMLTAMKFVVEVHHLVGFPRPADMRERIGAAMSRMFLPRECTYAVAVRTVNEEVKQTLVKWGIPAEKISVVPSLYLDRDVLKPNPAAAKTCDIAFCARLVANKGILRAIEAVAGMPGVTMVVIGDGPERTKAESLVQKLGCGDRITFKGWLPTQQDVVQAVQSAKLFLMPSTSEGGPRSAVEAMACGVPVISTNVGVMSDVIREGENGLFTDGSPTDMRAKISQLLSDDAKRSAMGESATKVIEKFERKKLIRAYADFLKECARRELK